MRRSLPFVTATAIAAFASLAAPASAQCVSGWQAGTTNSDMSGAIRWLRMWDPDGAGAAAPVLVASGDFTGANSAGTATASRIASWDGANWSALGTGLDGSGYCLATTSGDNHLYVAGTSFANAGGNSARRIAQWDGSTWAGVDTASGSASTLLTVTTVSADTIVVTGAFTSINGIPANRVAAWSSSTGWYALGDGMSSTTSAAITMPNGDIIVGGAALTTGGAADVTLNRIGRWDGSTWHAMDGGLSGLVRCFAVMPNGDLIAGGAFVTAGTSNLVVNKIARWDGSTWSALGSGINNDIGNNLDVFALAVMPNGDLVAAGDFQSAGGTPASRIARWSGTTWSAMGSGANALVRAAAVLPDGNLAIGGDFTTAGGNTALRFAIWSDLASATIDTQPESQTINLEDSAVFSLTASGSALSYRWQQQDLLNLSEFVDIDDGEVFDPFGNAFCFASGATTHQLTLSQCTGAQVFRCVVTNSCSSAISTEVTLSFFDPCPADFDGDGTVDFFDYDAFVVCFEGGACPDGKTADFDNDGTVDFFDYDAFVQAFETPCP